MEKITVIVPVYNAEKYLRRCIESIMNQTYKNLEILVIIDGATDSSAFIMEKYAKEDSRIKIIRRENKGIFYTRIEGIKKATSDYIYFVDADDWIEQNAIETMYQYQEKYHANIVRCKNYYKDENEKIIKDHKVQYFEKKEFCNQIYINLFGSYDFATIWNQLIDKRYFSELEKMDRCH